MKEVKISEIISLHREGKTKKDIVEMFNLNTAAVKVLFEIPSVKALDWSRRKRPNVVFVDDTATSSFKEEDVVRENAEELRWEN